MALAGPGQAEFDLTPVPAGDHVMALIAWAPDATAKPVSVTLPSVTIRPEPGRPAAVMASASGTLVPAIARLVAADEDTCGMRSICPIRRAWPR